MLSSCKHIKVDGEKSIEIFLALPLSIKDITKKIRAAFSSQSERIESQLKVLYIAYRRLISLLLFT